MQSHNAVDNHQTLHVELWMVCQGHRSYMKRYPCHVQTVQCMTSLAIFTQLAIIDKTVSLNINAAFQSLHIKLCRSAYNH